MGFAETFKTLSDPVRREILILLKAGSMSAGDIAAQFDMTAATISYHLKILKKSGLVYETKEKNYIYYSLNISMVEEVMLWLAELKGESEDDEEKSKTHSDYKHYYDPAGFCGTDLMEQTSGTDTNPL